MKADYLLQSLCYLFLLFTFSSSSSNLIKDKLYKKRPTCQKGAKPPIYRFLSTSLLSSVREDFAKHSYDAYLIEVNDGYMTIGHVPCESRLSYISGFNGSSGIGVIFKYKYAALSTDARYHLQIEQQLDCDWYWFPRTAQDKTLQKFVLQNLPVGSIVGADPDFLTYYQWINWRDALKEKNIELVIDENSILDDYRPSTCDYNTKVHKIVIHEKKYAGVDWTYKKDQLLKHMKKKNIDAILITKLEEVAWFFNLRSDYYGSTGLFKSCAFVARDLIRLYLSNHDKIEDKEMFHYLYGAVEIKPLDQFQHDQAIFSQYDRIVISPDSSYTTVQIIPSEKLILEETPIEAMMFTKNTVELQGMSNANLRDSVAYCEFMSELEERIVERKEHWDEYSAGKLLDSFKKSKPLYQKASYPNHCAFGPSGAFIHYIAKETTARTINDGSIFTMDSGGHYLDGTTDISRSVHFGIPSPIQKEIYTRILMGMIDVFTTTFIEKTNSDIIDHMARRYLQKIGLDYNHASFYSFGVFLTNQHKDENHILEPGQVYVIDPGFYAPEEFGIRLSTMVRVVQSNTKYNFEKKAFYRFEPMSLVPFEPQLINVALMSHDQKKWLANYNKRVREVVGKEFLDKYQIKAFQWLLKKTFCDFS